MLSTGQCRHLDVVQGDECATLWLGPGCLSLGGYAHLAMTSISQRFLLLLCPNTSSVCDNGFVSFALLRNGQVFWFGVFQAWEVWLISGYDVYGIGDTL